MFAYLLKIKLAVPEDEDRATLKSREWAANDLGKEIDVLMQQTFLLPAQRAALFEFMGQTPGYRIVPHAVDVIGRSGVGIAWHHRGFESMIILNSKSYAYLGDRIDFAVSQHGPDAHANIGSALVKFAIVSQVPPYAHGPAAAAQALASLTASAREPGRQVARPGRVGPSWAGGDLDSPG